MKLRDLCWMVLAISGSLAVLSFGSKPAAAQQVAVQQPVVGVFQANTTVTVPDRGSALLGGVSSAASGRTSFGPLRPGSSRGFSREAASASVHVFIHDFQAMDEALLATASSERPSRLDPRIVGRLERRDSSDKDSLDRQSSDIERASHAERLAEQAEARGKFAVARLHWQRAARHGSVRAVERLAEENDSVAQRR